LNPGYRPRVVLADDHPLILEAAIGVLSPRFDVVAAVGSGVDAIAATSQLDPDLVVLDIAMPGLNGFQTASAIAARGPRPRIAFMSAHMEDEYVLEGLNRGASAFIAKQRMRQDLVPALELANAGHVFFTSAGVLPQRRRTGSHYHDLQLYGSDHALIDAVGDYFGAALDAGDSIVAIATPAHLDGFDARLRARGVDVADLIASGRYSPVDADTAIDAVVVDGAANEAQFIATFDSIVAVASRADGGSRHVSAFGEMAPVLCGRQQPGLALALERLSTEYQASRPVSILCAYSAVALGAAPDLTAEVCAAHGAVLTGDVHG
jgi:DNA-binding NarL/FixJ family response regulator